MTSLPSPPRQNKQLALENVLRLYLRHIQLVRPLALCHDQIVQPQKRLVLRQVLDAVLGRLSELKVRVEFIEVRVKVVEVRVKMR